MGDVHSNAGFRKLEQEPLAKAGLREAWRRGIPGGTLAKGSLRLARGTEASQIMLGWRVDCGPQGPHMMGTSAKAREATGSIPTSCGDANGAPCRASGQDPSGGQAASLFRLSSPN